MHTDLIQPFSEASTVIQELHRLILHENGQLWALQDNSKNSYPLQAGELPRAKLAAHLAGDVTIAARLLQQTTNLAKAGCIDLDIPRDGATIRDMVELGQGIAAEAQAHGCNAYLEYSGRRGVHVWLFSDRPLPGATWQAALKALAAAAGFTAKESFPCGPTCGQEQKSIKLPCGLHQLTGNWAGFLDNPIQWVEDRPDLPDQALRLPQLQQTPVAAIVALAQAAQPAPAKQSSSTQNPEFTKHFPNTHPGCIQQLLDHGCPVELEYNSGNATLARYAVARGLSEEEAIQLAEAMAIATPDTHPTSKGQAEKVANFRSVYASARRKPDTYAWGCSYALSGVKLKDKAARAARGCPGSSCPSWPKEWEQPGPQQALTGSTPKAGLHYRLWAAIATVAEAGQELRPSTLLQALEAQEPDSFGPDYQAALAWADTDADHATERETFAYLLQNPDTVEEALALDVAPAGFVCDPPGFTTWAAYLDQLLALSPPLLPQTFTAHLKRIRDTGIRVLGSTQNTKAIAALADRTQAVDQVLDDLVNYGNSLLRRASSDIELMADQVPGLLAELFSRPQQAIATPSQWLNNALNGGWQPGKLYVLSAPPAAGKTTFTQWLGDYAARAKVPVLVASYEMTREQLFTAGLSRLAGLNSQQIEARAWTSPSLTTTQQQTLITEIQQAALTYQAEISPYLTIVEAGPEHTAAKLKGAIAHTRGQLGLTEADPLLVIVDYLQLLFTGDDRLDSGQNETLRVSRIATALKQLARDTKTAVIAISDITKEAYQKALASGSLDMSALRDSFKIAHAADSILLLQTGVINREGGPVDQLDLAALNAPQEKAAAIAQARSAYPLRSATKDGYARLSILKNRGGGLADPLFVYHKALHRFTPIDLPVAAQAGPDKDPGF